MQVALNRKMPSIKAALSKREMQKMPRMLEMPAGKATALTDSKTGYGINS